MVEAHKNIDLTQGNVIGQLELFKQNSQRLQLEAFKLDSVFHILNNCADRCQLQYRETGIKARGEGNEDVECFTNCVTKSHKLSGMLFQ